MARKKMSAAAYRKKLQDPRWQRKRFDILERASWRCEWCGTDEVNLQVHHGYYARDAEPWEYPDDIFYCLCDGCHGKAEDLRRALQFELARIHPRHHECVCDLLRQVQAAIDEDPSQLEAAEVTRD